MPFERVVVGLGGGACSILLEQDWIDRLIAIKSRPLRNESPKDRLFGLAFFPYRCRYAEEHLHVIGLVNIEEDARFGDGMLG